MDTIIGLLALALIGYLWYFLFTRHQANENKEKSTWRKLASLNHLNFKPATSLKGKAEVTGKFRGYYLELCTFRKDRPRKKAQVYTYLSLSPKNTRKHRGSDLKQKIRIGNHLTVEEVTDLLVPRGLSFSLKGQIRVKPNGKKLSYEQVGLEDQVEYLQFIINLLADLGEIYSNLVELGGEAVPALCEISQQSEHILYEIARQLLEDIAHETTNRLGEHPSRLLCPQCLTHCFPHKIPPTFLGNSLTYYGCRNCGQSREFLTGIQVIAVLDKQMIVEQIKQNGILQVNWLLRQSLFDFDEVNIVKANEEDIERFAVQVGNDSDISRKPKYEQMQCKVKSNSSLSDNSIWILNNVFGNVISE